MRLYPYCAVAVILLLQACHHNVQEQQLTRVARDWSQIIRASQIIPVYPLHEDLLPGDVFLVQTTVDNQQNLYRKKGFLPLDPPIARIRPSGYADFYGDFKRICPVPASASTPAEVDVATLLYNPAALERLPNVAFPSYSFEIDSSSSFGAALPLQALTVGLDLTRSRKARASVAIREAYTFGVDIQSLLRDVRAWQANDPKLLEPYKAEANKRGGYRPRAYLRVVNRVFVAQVMDVQFESLERRGADAKAQLGMPGLSSPTGAALNAVDGAVAAAQSLGATNCQLAGGDPTRSLLPGVLPDRVPTLNNSQVLCKLPPTMIDQVRSKLPTDVVRSLGKTLDQAANAGVPTNILSSLLPQLRLQATSQSQGSVGLRERFNRPLAVGYLAFDIPIDDQGRLGAAIPSYAVLERQPIEKTFTVPLDREKARTDTLLDQLIDVPNAYAVAAETLRCIERSSGQRDLLKSWQAQVPSNLKPAKVHDQMRLRLAAIQQSGFPPASSNDLLQKALAGGTACPR